jgi:hypothetical protein
MVSTRKKEVSTDTRETILRELRNGKSLADAARAAKLSKPRLQALLDEDDSFASEVENATAAGDMNTRPGMLPLPPTMRPPPPPIPTPPPPLNEVTGGDSGPSWTDRWANIRGEAAALGLGETGFLMWVERACIRAGLHALDRQWLWHFSEFYESKKTLDSGRWGLRAAKSDSNCRAVSAEVMMKERRLEPGVVGVCPVMSANMREADDRFDTIVSVLAACGLEDKTGQRGSEEPHTFQRAGGGNSARVIALKDGQGQKVEFRIYPASVAGAAGFTGIAGLCDEVDLWGKEQGANPAKRVFEVLLARYVTQPGAKLHVVSASYNPESEHAKMIAEGDTNLQRVARLGELGAQKDTEARATLAVIIGSSDPLLLTPSSPKSVDIPCWVSNPIAPIEECYKAAKGDIKRMMFLYGGRVNTQAGKFPGMTVEDLRALGDMNRKILQRGAGGQSTQGDLMRFDGLPSWDPRSRDYRGGGRSI